MRIQKSVPYKSAKSPQYLFFYRGIVCVLTFILILSCVRETKIIKISGQVFGTSYSVSYYSEDGLNFEAQFDSLFYEINKSMSTYQTNSIVSKLNRNKNVLIDAHFLKVLETSREIYKATDGVFDPTIGKLVNAWNFGPEGNIDHLDSLKVDSLMRFVGFNKINRINKSILKPKGIYLDFNAIAKGYAVDVIAEFLNGEHIENYLVELGGELRANGKNPEKGRDWKVGIETPHFDENQSILRTVILQNEAMATSGTYRKFRTDHLGNRYAHIIDTKTGYPSKTNILSVSVIAEYCMTADAYATAFQAMGTERVEAFLRDHPKLKVFLVIENESKALETLAFNGFPEE